MKNENPLSDLYQLYSKGELAKKNLEIKVFLHLFNNHGKYHGYKRNRDQWDEFLGWLYPRLVKAIDRYREQGSSFDAYISSLVHSAFKEYRRREADHFMTEYACWKARAEEMSAYEAEPEYPEKPKKIFIPEDIRPRHILILFLKAYHFATDEKIQQVAKITRLESEVIRDMVEEIRKRCSRHEVERINFRDRVYSQHYRCLAYEKRMNAALPGTDYHARMKDRFERAKKRFTSMSKRLGRMRISATNRMVAEVMGLPKGTIDSSLFTLKNRLAAAGVAEET